MRTELVARLLDECTSDQSPSLVIGYLVGFLDGDRYRIFPIERRRARPKNDILIPPLPEFQRLDWELRIWKRRPAFERGRPRTGTRINAESYQLVLIQQISFAVVILECWEPFAAPQSDIRARRKELVNLRR